MELVQWKRQITQEAKTVEIQYEKGLLSMDQRLSRLKAETD